MPPCQCQLIVRGRWVQGRQQARARDVRVAQRLLLACQKRPTGARPHGHRVGDEPERRRHRGVIQAAIHHTTASIIVAIITIIMMVRVLVVSAGIAAAGVNHASGDRASQ